MAQTLGTGGTGGNKPAGFELNLIPFIDLLTCITAFLMASSVWINIARLDVKPAGLAHGEPDCLGDCEEPRLSVLIEADQIWVGVSRLNDFETIARGAEGYDWARLEAALKQHKSSAWFEHKTAIEVAADSTADHPIQYQALIAAMDVAVKVGFVDVGITEPQGLSARPRL